MPHTPGPWTLDTDRTVLCPPDQAAPGGGRGIAEIRSWMGPETADANARLIAAAPSLLAALKLIVKAPGAVKSTGTRLRYDLHLTMAEYDAICAVIAKAEGR